MQSHVDMVIAARTGQGKTLCFGIPILDIIVRHIQKHDKVEPLDKIFGLIMSPTRELAIQIKDHLEAVVPPEYQEAIKIVAIVGGMSIEKQLRLLKQKPAIIVATPGRLWELMSEQANEYLIKGLPMTDVLVLDEADRMMADGHFREMRDILSHIYYQRVQIKQGKKKSTEEPKSEKKQAAI